MTMHEVKALAALIELMKKEKIYEFNGAEFSFCLPMPETKPPKKPDADPIDKPDLLSFVTKKIPADMWAAEKLPEDLKDKPNEQDNNNK